MSAPTPLVQMEAAVSVALFEAAAICRLVEIIHTGCDEEVPDDAIQGAMTAAQKLILGAQEEFEQYLRKRRTEGSRG